MSFSQRLQKAWLSKTDWLSIALLDVSWVYGGLVKLRRKLYQRGIKKSTQIKVPVIVVGNVIAGGAGKTPLVIALAQFLRAKGWQPGIVSRGYRSKRGHGAKSTGAFEVLEVLASTPVIESGDEPALIKAATNLPVFVSQQRCQAALALLAAYPQTNVILCDDGLQHLALQRDIEICVFDERGTGNGRLLPAGPLREHWPRPVDFIVHRGGFDSGYKITRRLADEAVLADGSRVALADLQHHKLTALAGIAQPENFFGMLRARGLRLQQTLALPDHYDFHSDFHSDLNSKLSNIDEGCWLICTEKDAIKLRQTPLAQQRTIVAVPLIVDLPEIFTQALLEKLSSLPSRPQAHPQ
jgi:tetraacyldisaccharide 4'-kinase